MDVRISALLLLLLVLSGFACNDDHTDTTASCPPVDDTVGTLYELSNQSVLIHSSMASDLVTEPLIGTFRLRRLPPGHNIELAFELTGLRVCAASQFIIESVGTSGVLGFFGHPGPIIPGTFEGSINGEKPILFNGRGPYHLDEDGAIILDGVNFCAPSIPTTRCDNFPSGGETGFYLKIFAAPKLGADTPALQ